MKENINLKVLKYSLEELICPSCQQAEVVLIKQNGMEQTPDFTNHNNVKIVYQEEIVSADQLNAIEEKLGSLVTATKKVHQKTKRQISSLLDI